jgi:hypothetical protein
MLRRESKTHKSVTCFATLQGGDLVFVIPMAWFERELMFYLVYFISFCFSVAFPSYSSKLTLLHSLYQFVFG